MSLHTKLACFLTLLFSAGFAAAQQPSGLRSQNGTIEGTALDTNGGVVPGAAVVLDGATAADQQSGFTSDAGFFQFGGVKPGVSYHVTVSAAGFADWKSQEIVLNPGQFLLLTNISLRISTVQITVAAETEEQIATEEVRTEETQRALGFIPNFYVTYDKNPAPLTAKLKYHLALRSLIDPVTSAGFVLNATAYQLAGYPHYSRDIKGYGQRLGSTFAGGYTNILLGNAVLPSLLHQDPRYFYQGTGTTKSRFLHAISLPLITRGDNGRSEINFSGIGGDLASGAVANAYYPENERGLHLVLQSAAIGAGGRMANGILQEFVLRKRTSRFRKQDQDAAGATH
jgi:Carboxypeptidase regulatory-like domain